MGVFQRDGKWGIDFYDGNGVRRREIVSANHRVALDALRKRQAEVAEGKFFPERRVQDITFRYLAQLFIEQHAKHRKSVETLTLRVNRLIEMLGDTRLRAITPLVIQKLRNKIKETRSVSTANRYHAILRTMFNRARDWQLFYGENPASVTRLEKEPPHRLRFLNANEIKNLLLACHPRLLPVVACALTTGMRRGEILGLKWTDIDLERGLIYLTVTKSGKAREIPITAKLLALFESMPHSGQMVFDIPTITLRRYFDNALEKAGITGFHFHDLRHTFASHFIMRTGNLPALQNILGHSTPLLTQRYAHLSNAHLKENMDQLDAGWSPVWTLGTTKLLTPSPENDKIVNVEIPQMPR